MEPRPSAVEPDTPSGPAPARDTVVRILLVAFVAVAAVVTVGLVADPDWGPIGTVGVVFYPAAAIGHAVLARYYGRRWTRRVLVGTELVLIPAQFLLSIPSDLPLLGMLLSAGIVALLRPRFPQLSPRTRKWFLWLHVGLSVSWLGLSMAMLVLSLTGQLAGDYQLRHDAYRMMHIFDLAIVIPVVVLSIVSGLVVSLGTKWGLVRNRWVLTKFLLALSIPAVAGFQHHWISELIERTSADPTTRPGGLGLVLTLCMASYGVILWTATALSIWKPWGKTRWGRRATVVRRRGARLSPGRDRVGPVAAAGEDHAVDSVATS